jgi:hypothetical protein
MEGNGGFHFVSEELWFLEGDEGGEACCARDLRFLSRLSSACLVFSEYCCCGEDYC